MEEKRRNDLGKGKKVHEKGYATSKRRYGKLSIGSKVAFASELGGDYCNIAGLKEGLFLCLADISGKGIAAALFAALLNQSVIDPLMTHRI